MSLETAGRFLMGVRDQAIANGVALLDGRLNAPADQELARNLAALRQETREPLVATIVDNVLVAFLSALDAERDVALLARGTSVADESDGLAGELFGTRGWIASMSRYPASV
jgi:hypothetical protein